MTRTFTSDEIAALIAKLEAAGGPDRELDEAIVQTLCPGAIISIYVQGDAEKTVFHAEPLVENKAYVPAYTASIDMALTLVPSGYGAVSMAINERGQSSARLGHPYTFGNGATPAIALCIAALKARATVTP